MSRLADKSRALRGAMAAADTGPLVVAADVVALAENWKDYQQEAEGLNITAWLTRELGSQGRNLAFFKQRDLAVKALGEDIRRSLHHEVAVYIFRNVPEDKRMEAKSALTKEYIKHNRCPLTPQQAKPIIWEIIGKVRGSRDECPGCVAKTEEIMRLRSLLGLSAAAE